jgi:phosphatidate cytidylyltransferase
MNEFKKRLGTSLILGSCFWFSFLYFPPKVFSFILIGILLVIIFHEWRRFFDLKNPYFWLMLPLYPIMPFGLLIYMNQHPLYHNLLLELFLIVASFDTGSYIVGNLFGRHKIAPRISPGKTIEGFFGGYLFAVIGLSLLETFEMGRSLPKQFILGFTFLICVLALIGDLFESWLKRNAGIKDSGDSLPGHGGFLDRFDGIMIAAVFFFIFRDYLVTILG